MNKKIIISFLLLIILIIIFFIIKNIPNEKNEIPSLEDKIGQMLIVGFRGTEVNSESKIIKDINEYNVGGVILFDYDVPSSGERERNIKNPEQTKKLINDIKNLTNDNLFFAVDAEGGYINRLKEKYGFIPIPSAQEMGEKEPQQTYLSVLPLAKELHDLGFNLNFAPVVDVNINPDNPVIGYLERSFSDDPEIVYKHAKEFIEAMHEYNILTSVKHFPGHGSSENDSHLGMVDITNTYMQDEELLPYQKLINESDLDMIMTAHVMNTNIDPDYPATMSPIFLQDILRNELNFQGIIVSDDMQMGAIADNYGFEEALIQSIKAGCNILILSNNNKTYDENIIQKAIDVIKNAVENGLLEEEYINSSYKKIQDIKN